MPRPLPAIFGLSGPELTPYESTYFAQVQPLGFILMGRNCANPAQVRHLTTSLRALLRHTHAPILIDQEGGRVARLKPPHWSKLPSAGVIGAIYKYDPALGIEAAGILGSLIGHQLRQLGITVNCAPVLDRAHPDMHDVIGDRSFAAEPEVVAVLGKAFATAMLEQGVLPVIKHLPGHGMVKVDPHLELPVVSQPLDELEPDFIPFRELAGMPIGMTSHILFNKIDPEYPASQSSVIVDSIIRNKIGFDGLLLSDDLDMRALKGDLLCRSQRVLATGTDLILICNSNIAQISQIGTLLPPMTEAAWSRWERAKKLLRTPGPFDMSAANHRLDMILAVGDIAHQLS